MALDDMLRQNYVTNSKRFTSSSARSIFNKVDRVTIKETDVHPLSQIILFSSGHERFSN